MPSPALSWNAAADDLLPAESLAAPPLYRSEGFAEDLFDDADNRPGRPQPNQPAPWGRIGTWLSALPLAVTVLSAAASVLA
ncbi:MAG: hypothetical protein RJA10_2640 [Pseudomonadota bacterium]|jgi:hypothetical protein